MSKYTVRVSFEMLTDGKVNGSSVTEDHSDDLITHGAKCVAIAKKLGVALPAAQEELFQLAAGIKYEAELAKHK